VEGEALLDSILENTPPLEPLHVEPKPSHEEVSSAKAEPISPLEITSPEPKEKKIPNILTFCILRMIFLKVSETPRNTHAKRGHLSLSFLLCL
jgi:hypothetical protein